MYMIIYIYRKFTMVMVYLPTKLGVTCVGHVDKYVIHGSYG